MDNCPRCAKPRAKEDKFCGYCGFNLVNQHTDHSFTQQELKVSDVRFNLGVVYLKQGKYDLAIENFEKVLEQDPGNPMAHQMLDQARTGQHL